MSNNIIKKLSILIHTIKICCLLILAAIIFTPMSCFAYDYSFSSNYGKGFQITYERIFPDITLSNGPSGFLPTDPMYFYCTDTKGVNYRLNLPDLTEEKVDSASISSGTLATSGEVTMNMGTPIPLSSDTLSSLCAKLEVNDISSVDTKFLLTSGDVSYYSFSSINNQNKPVFAVVSTAEDVVFTCESNQKNVQSALFFGKVLFSYNGIIYNEQGSTIACITPSNGEGSVSSSENFQVLKNGLLFIRNTCQFFSIDGKGFKINRPADVPSPSMNIIGNDFPESTYLASGHMYYLGDVSGGKALIRVTFENDSIPLSHHVSQKDNSSSQIDTDSSTNQDINQQSTSDSNGDSSTPKNTETKQSNDSYDENEEEDAVSTSFENMAPIAQNDASHDEINPSALPGSKNHVITWILSVLAFVIVAFLITFLIIKKVKKPSKTEPTLPEEDTPSVPTDKDSLEYENYIYGYDDQYEPLEDDSDIDDDSSDEDNIY